MNRFGVKNIVLLLAACAVALGAGEIKQPLKERSKIELLTIGFAEPEWPVVKSGEKWLGLFKTGEESFELAEVVLTVEIKRSECAGEDLPYITISDSRRLVFLVRGSDRMNPGPVKVSKPNAELMAGQSHLIDNFPRPHWYLYALGCITSTWDDSKEPMPVIEDYGLYIRDENKAIDQRLLTVEKSDLRESLPSFEWIGDLDGDNKPDFCIDAHPYPGGDHILYLSSEAAPGELVHEVARYIRRSC